MKERVLTVLVPIKSADVTAQYPTLYALTSAVTPSAENINNIYAVGYPIFGYVRTWLNPATNQYEFHQVVDREFPYIGKPLEIFDFTYDATRMGSAPTITAQGVMWYADKDSSGNDVTLEGLWSQECHVSFNGENFYLKQIPTSSKSHEDARYKYEIDFVSERVVLERVYLYDVVQPFITERPVSESSSFSFYGDIEELAKRINASLLRSGLASLVRKTTYYYVPSGEDIGHLVQKEVPYLTYEQWNGLGYKSVSLVGVVFDVDEELTAFIEQIYTPLHGNYQSYLFSYIYENTNGTYTTNGYICIIGKDKKGANVSSEEKLITFENNTIHEALQQVHDTFGLQYYITKEKHSNGDFTGNTLIMIADCENDFADMDGADFVRDNDGIPTTEHPWDYGMENELLSKEKTNTTDKIITRITGVGSSENIPWYYPNPTADGWIKPMYKRGGVLQNIDISYPTSEENMVEYEKYLKNRIGNIFTWGSRLLYATIENQLLKYLFSDGWGYSTDDSTVYFAAGLNYTFNMDYVCSDNSVPPIKLCATFDSDIHKCGVRVGDLTSDPVTYTDIVLTNGVEASLDLISGRKYNIGITILSNYQYTQGSQFPIYATEYDYEGYRYEYQEWQYGINQNVTHCIIDGFYKESDAVYYGSYTIVEINGIEIYYHKRAVRRQSDDGSFTYVDVEPMERIVGKFYRNISDGIIYRCKYDDMLRTGSLFSSPARMTPAEFMKKHLSLYMAVNDDTSWFYKGRAVNLSDYSLAISDSISPQLFDTIEFRRVKYVTPQPTLMPEIYIKTDGERRFYNAVNYPLATGVPDTMIGEEESDGRIINPIYYKEGTTTHFDFENEYIKERPHEHIETFEDVKPTIKGQINTVDGHSFRVDVVEEFAYDMLDNDEVWESNDGWNVSGEYKHPYFFAKLRPLGFNIFDLALQDDMVLSLTTGSCGACNFKIGVDENTKKNPVQIWEYDVYGGSSYENRGQKLFSAGDIRRHIDTSSLYYDKTGDASGYTHVDSVSVTSGFLVESGTHKFVRRVYSAADVINGDVGSLKQEGKNHFDGDVVTNGKFINSQQDTSDNYVWVALMKDTDTYGVIMPSARPDYGDGNFSVYIRPKSISDVHTGMSTDSEDEENADKFVLTNIRMPQIYLRRAERELSKKIVSYMYENNYQKFNFSIKFSRIFLAENNHIESNINENSVLYVTFNNKIYRQYAKHYTYRMSMKTDASLPEISVEMNEELSVSRTKKEQDAVSAKRIYSATAKDMMRELTLATDRLSRNTVGKNDDTIIGGNMVSRDAVTSFGELLSENTKTKSDIFGTQVDLHVNHYTKDDFFVDDDGHNLRIGVDKILRAVYTDGYNIKRDVYDVSTGQFSPTGSGSVSFNVALQDDLSVIENTIFHRLGGQVATNADPDCDHDVLIDSTGTELFWYSSTASTPTPYNPYSCPTSIFIQ